MCLCVDPKHKKQKVVYPKLLDEPTMTDLMDADSDNNLAFGPLSRSIPQQMAVRSAGDYKDYKVPKGPPTVLGLRGQFDNIPPPPSRPGEVVKKMDDMMKELLLQEARTNVIDEAYIKNNASRLMEEARKRLQKDVLPLATKAIEDQNAYRALLVRDHKPKITAWVFFFFCFLLSYLFLLLSYLFLLLFICVLKR